MWWKRKAKYEDLKTELDKKVFHFLEKEDFQRGSEDLVYRKKTDFGFELFELEYLSQTKELKIEFGLRFNQIEDIYHKIHQIELSLNSYTLFINAVNLLHFKEIEKAKFRFKKVEDVKVGIENVKFIFENYAKEYFKKYDSILKFSQLVNRGKYEEDLRGDFQFHGNKEDAAINGIIASNLLKEKDIDDLKRRHLTNISSKDLESTFKLIDKYFEYRRLQ